MSRVEVLRKIKSIEQAIETRSKRLAQLEAIDNPEAIIEAVKIKNELDLLRTEKNKLDEEAEELKTLLESRLPELEKAYLDAVKREKAMLREVYETCKHLENKIQQLREIANEVHVKYYIPYRNICDELQITSKSFHLLDIPFITQLSRWLANFTEWFEKTRGAE
jgi:DNA repair exonuclease SbcCD ATPase subunit